MQVRHLRRSEVEVFTLATVLLSALRATTAEASAFETAVLDVARLLCDGQLKSGSSFSFLCRPVEAHPVLADDRVRLVASVDCSRQEKGGNEKEEVRQEPGERLVASL